MLRILLTVLGNKVPAGRPRIPWGQRPAHNAKWTMLDLTVHYTIL